MCGGNPEIDLVRASRKPLSIRHFPRPSLCRAQGVG